MGKFYSKLICLFTILWFGNQAQAQIADFEYVMQFEIENTSGGPIQDKPVALYIPLDSLQSEGLLQADFLDIQFGTECQTQDLNHFIEDQTLWPSPDSAVVWVRVPTIADGLNEIFMFFGSTTGPVTVNPQQNFNLVFPNTNYTSTDQEALTGVVTFESFEVLAGHTVFLTNNPDSLWVNAERIVISGTIDASTFGEIGGTTGLDGLGTGGGFGNSGAGCLVGSTPQLLTSGGGGSYGGTGGAGGNGELIVAVPCAPPAGSPGVTYDVPLPITVGSGGGAGNGSDGGNGGGAVFLNAQFIGVAGSVLANGQDGNQSAAGAGGTSFGGGGSGGGILIHSPVAVINGTVEANGGPGGNYVATAGALNANSGGGGGSGIIRLFNEVPAYINGMINLNGGPAGTGGTTAPGQPGTGIPVENAGLIPDSFFVFNRNRTGVIQAPSIVGDPQFCSGNPYNALSSTPNFGFEDYEWNFNFTDGSSLDTLIATESVDPLDSLISLPSAVSNFEVSSIAFFSSCVFNSDTLTVTIAPGVDLQPLSDTIFCSNEGEIIINPSLNPNATFINQEWLVPLPNSVTDTSTLTPLVFLDASTGRFSTTVGNVPGLNYLVAYTAETDLGCVDTIAQTIVLLNGPTGTPVLSSDPSGGFCLGENVELTAVSSDPAAMFTYEWSSPDPDITFTNPDQLITNATTSTSSFQSTFIFKELTPDGCFASDTLILDALPTPKAQLLPDNPYCSDGPARPIDVVFVDIDGNIVAPVQGVWDANGILPQDDAEGIYRPEIAFLASGDSLLEIKDTITFTYSDPVTGCTVTVTDTAIIKKSDTKGLQINTSDQICINSTPFNLDIDYFGGVWSGAGVLDSFSGIYDPEVAGVGRDTIRYNVTNNCLDDIEISKVIDIINIPDPAINQTPTLCEGALPVELSAKAIDGVWTGPGIIDPLAGIFDPRQLEPGTYTITHTVRRAEICIAKDSAQITISGNPIAIAGDDLSVCSDSFNGVLGGNRSAAGGIPDYTYLWEPFFLVDNRNAEKPVASIDKSTTFTLRVTDALGCEGRDQVTIIINPEVFAEAGEGQLFCENEIFERSLGGAPSAFGGVAPFTYQWEPAIELSNPKVANPVLATSNERTYTLTVLDVNGCKAIDTVSFAPVSAPQLGFLENPTICNGDSFLVDVDTLISGGSGNRTITWNPPTFLDTAAGPQVNIQPIRTTSYTVSVVDINNCKGEGFITIYVDSSLQVKAGLDQVLCSGNSLKLGENGTTIGGAPPYTIRWEPALGLNNDTIASPIAVPDSSITYTVSIADQNNCKAVDSIAIQVAESPELDIRLEVGICEGAPATLGIPNGTDPIIGGTPPYSYQWLPQNKVDNHKKPNPITVNTTQQEYTLTVIDKFGCTSRSVVDAFFAANPNVNAGADKFACSNLGTTLGGSPTALGGNGPFTYSWNPASLLNNPNSSNPQATPQSSTSFFLEVEDALGCKGQDEVFVNVSKVPEIDLGEDLGLCLNSDQPIILGEDAVSGSAGGLNFSWQPTTGIIGPNNTQTIQVRPTKGIEYTLRVTDNNNCIASDKIFVDAYATPVPGFRTEKVGENGVRFIDESSLSVGWRYDFGDGSAPDFAQNPVHYFPASSTFYTVCQTVFTEDFCESQDCELVNLKTVNIESLEEAGIAIYPNPTSQFIQLESVNEIEWQIRSLNGELIQNGQLINTTQVDVSTYPNGQYLIMFIVDNKVLPYKFVKQ